MDLALQEDKRVLRRHRVDHFDVAEDSVIRYVQSCLNVVKPELLYWNSGLKVNNLPSILADYEGLVDLKQINSRPRINKHFELVNNSIESGNYFITSVETKGKRKERIYQKYPNGIRQFVYAADFFFHRVIAKLKTTRQLYYSITKGTNRALSLTETLGRLVSCGFEIIDYKEIGYKTYIVTKKVTDPVYDLQPTYGPFCQLQRVGCKGEKFTVYKIRTMHPYSEYLQNYIFEKNDLQDGGKINNDFRVTSWGKWFRRLWIDELPMLYNWLKREMKLVGVRPLSGHYFNLYPSDVQEMRYNIKPGLVPPFYADLPVTFDEIVESERKYLTAYFKKPIRTDIKYFFKAMYNIFIKRARSN
jgi:lipopolysaccharide/colanic/teichoic acid biosynthesis glycosyltransferase